MTKNLIIILLMLISFSAERATSESFNQNSESEAATSAEVKMKKRVTRSKLGANDPPILGSSFVRELDNLDPIIPNRDNLKDDEEPVLETIRSVAEVPPEVPPENVQKEKEKEKIVEVDNSPDLDLEKKFHKLYKIYNSKPTPDDIWKAATIKQQAQEYIVQKGDTLWSISKVLFGDANFWPKIWSLNKQGILNPHFIKPKTKIYFYFGDESSPPTLAVGESNLKDSTNTNDSKKLTEVKSITEDDPNYGLIPDSLPVHRNAEYFFDPKKAKVDIDFGQRAVPDYNINTEIFITDSPLKTDVKIRLPETAKLRCYDGRVIKEIEYLERLIEDYEIYESIDSFKTTIGTMYAYRRFGSAKIYNSNFLKLYGCTGIISTGLIVVPKEKMTIHRNRKLSVTKMARIVGGPDQKSQLMFMNNQIAYVDFGHNSYATGQEYKTISQVTDEINGQFKVLYKYGSFAVVVFTEVNNAVEVGDKVILN